MAAEYWSMDIRGQCKILQPWDQRQRNSEADVMSGLRYDYNIHSEYIGETDLPNWKMGHEEGWFF